MYNPRMGHRTWAVALAACTLIATGCRAREVEKDLRITDVRTGWYDTGVVNGQNKLVPSVTFRIQNVSQEAIKNVQLNAVFRGVDQPDKSWGDHLVRAINADGLVAGATGGTLVLRSPFGYTSTEPRLTMLEHSQFVDAKVEVFGRHRSRPWTKMGEFMIDRQLLTE
jgi:hypothetical protein